MQRIVFGNDMKKVDGFTIDVIGIPSLVLMERAAFSVVTNLVQGDLESPVLVVCGSGNNGADGIAIARMLKIRGANVEVYLASESKGTPEYKTQCNIARKIGVRFIEELDIYKYKLIIDAIFGVGLSKPIEGSYAKLVNMINEAYNQQYAQVIAVDIPSGIDSKSGFVNGCAVIADKTVTFGAAKTGLYLKNARDYCGKIIVEDIGFPKQSYDMLGYNMFTYDNNSDMESFVKRPAYSNKGTYGKVLIVAGSKDMCGAAYMSAMACFRMGVGVVRIFTPSENKDNLFKMIPEAIVTGYDVNDFDVEVYQEALDWASVIVIGPGLGVQEYTIDLVKKALCSSKDLIADADALNIISKNLELTKFYHSKVVITPHIGEMAKLLNTTIDEVSDNVIIYATEYAKHHNIICVLKDAVTIVADYSNNIYMNTSGNAGMATAGSGDVLAGVVAGVVANKSVDMDLFTKVTGGVFLHGKSGDVAAQNTGKTSLMAREIIEHISKVRKTEWKN